MKTMIKSSKYAYTLVYLKNFRCTNISYLLSIILSIDNF